MRILRGSLARRRIRMAFIGLSLAGMIGACSGGHSGHLGTLAVALFGGPANALVVNTSANQIGRLTQSGNSLVQTFNQYDALGRATSVQHVVGNVSYQYSTAYGYPQTSVALCSNNACGSSGPPGSVTVSSTFPDGEVVRYTYDAADEEQSIVATPAGGSAQTIVSQVVRNVRGQPVQVTYGDGTEQDHCYDDGAPCHCYSVSSGTPTCSPGSPPNTDLRLNGIKSYVTASQAALQDYTYTFDADGNITSVNDNLTPSLSASYAYDSLDRLISMTSNGTTYAYGYDTVGNLTDKEGVTQTYFPSGPGSVHPHALSAVGGVSYQYDPNGNLVSTTGAATNPALTWNPENMPSQVAYGSATTQKYFIGEALWKKAALGTNTYYLPSARVENGAVRKSYGSFAERDVDGTLKFYHGDHLGSSTLVTNASGAVVHRAAYMPYGSDRSVANYTPAYAESFTPKYQFNFKEKEEDGTGFYDYGARLYNPATGQWLSPDSVTSEARYAYANDNPLRYTDPTGHDPEDPPYVVKETVIDGKRTVTYSNGFVLQGPDTRQRDEAIQDLNTVTNFISSAEIEVTEQVVLGEVGGVVAGRLFSWGGRAFRYARAIRASVPEVPGLKIVIDEPIQATAHQARAWASEIQTLIDKGEIPVPQGSNNIAELMRAYTGVTGDEVALVRLKNGTRVLRAGIGDEVNPGKDAVRVIAHTHPSGVLGASTGDIRVAAARGQHSVGAIIGGKTAIRPTMSEAFKAAVWLISHGYMGPI